MPIIIPPPPFASQVTYFFTNVFPLNFTPLKTQTYTIVAKAPGGGGGSGASSDSAAATGSISFGGQGGGEGELRVTTMILNAGTTYQFVSFGAGNGGAQQGFANTTGNNGTAGGNIQIFGGPILAVGGAFGAGGIYHAVTLLANTSPQWGFNGDGAGAGQGGTPATAAIAAGVGGAPQASSGAGGGGGGGGYPAAGFFRGAAGANGANGWVWVLG